MGSFSIWHWLITLIVLFGIPALLIWLVVRVARRNSRSPTGARLQELADLRDKGLVTEEEYVRKRAELVRDL